jgi:hypothetical protein
METSREARGYCRGGRGEYVSRARADWDSYRSGEFGSGRPVYFALDDTHASLAGQRSLMTQSRTVDELLAQLESMLQN